MDFSINWLEDAPNISPEERATACDLKIMIGNQNACMHMQGTEGVLYDHITIAAYTLAEGLAHDWWRIFGARDTEYRLIKHRMGYATPDVRFRFDGAVFESYANQYVYQNPDTRFWGAPKEILSRQSAETTLASFIEAILLQLRKCEIGNTSAELRWARVRESRNDPDEALFCEAAGALNVDPYSISEQESAFIDQSGQFFSDEPLIEFLAGISHTRFREKTLAWIEASESRPTYHSLLPALSALSTQISATTKSSPGDRDWALGYRRARATRAALNMTTNFRIQGVPELANRLDATSFRRASKVNGLRALVSKKNENVHIHLRDRSAGSDARQVELFAFARAIGDTICFPNTVRSAVNDLHDADRQAAGRAFAAEFLAPIDEILSMQEDGNDVAAIADEMNVSTEVIERQVENQNRILTACA